MRPIFRPSARVRLRSPDEVGSASWVAGTFAALVFVVFLVERGATATAVGAVVGWVVAFSSGPLVSPGPENSGSAGLAVATVVVGFGLAAAFCAAVLST